MAAVSNVQCQQENVFLVNGMSTLAVDNDLRATALLKLFHADILAELTDADLLKPLYQSVLLRSSISVLLSDRANRRTMIKNELQAVRPRLNTGCLQYVNVPLGSAYYCKARAIVDKTIQCYALSDSSLCAYDPMFLQYFQIGRFIRHSELDLLDEMRSRLRESLTAISTAIVNKDQTALQTQVTLHQAYLVVTSDTCSNDWSKGFDCGNNEECKLQTIVRFDCLIHFLTRASSNFLTAKGSKSWTDASVIKEKAFLNIFLLYPPMLQLSSLSQADIASTISAFHKEVDDLRKTLDIPGFVVLLAKIPPKALMSASVKRSACSHSTIPQEYKNFCLITSLVTAIFQFTDSVSDSQNANIRVLNPSVDYKLLLEQLQLSRIAAYLEKQTQTYFQILSNQISEIPGYLQENFQAVASYFQSLANYDSKKSTTDIAAINGLLNTFRSSLSIKSTQVSQKFGLLLGLAIGATAAELIQRGVELALEIAINCNPLKHIFGGSDPGSIMDRVNEFMQGVVGMTRLIVLGTRIIPELAQRAQYIKAGFEKNDEFLDIVKTLVNDFNSDDPDVEAKAEKFLGLYNDYSPGILLSDITAFGTLWETAVDEMCDIAFEGGTAAAAAVQIGIASKGDCISIRPLITEVITLNEEIYDHQYELIETLATAVRAKYASKLAQDMQTSYSSQVQVDMNFIENTAIISFLVSTLHIWGIVSEYCDILTYTSGGTLPAICVSAKALPDQDAVARVISHVQDATCHAGSRNRFFLKVPTTTSSSANAGDKSYINIDKLFRGETVTFRIPNSSWLVSNGVISSAEANNAIFIEQFQMFLPAQLNGQQLVQINVQPDDANSLRNDQVTYLVQLSGYQSKYTVNAPSCFGTRTWLPYDFCQSFSQVCVSKDAKIERPIQPSIYNAWRIRLAAPENLTPPSPKTDFKIKVGVTLCTKSLSAGKKRDVVDESPVKYSLLTKLRTRQANSQFCCQNNMYWAGTSCQNCPSGSTRRLSGYYCE